MFPVGQKLSFAAVEGDFKVCGRKSWLSDSRVQNKGFSVPTTLSSLNSYLNNANMLSSMESSLIVGFNFANHGLTIIIH